MAMKKLPYRLIERDSDEGRPIYSMLEKYCERHHQDLPFNRIALAWAFAWKPDPDGRLTLGKCKRASDLDRELHDFDFVILLNEGFWNHEAVTEAMREALMDHELCHGAIAMDSDGEPKVDTRGRVVYRTVKHDIEEFTQIVERHGVWKQDLHRFANAILQAEKYPLLAEEKPAVAPETAAARHLKATVKRFADAMSEAGGGSIELQPGPGVGEKRVVKFPAKPKKKSPPTRRPRA